jgi:hypothetical protein
VNRTIGAQATTLAYVDIISVMAVLVACLVPFVLLMKRPPKRAAAPSGH